MWKGLDPFPIGALISLQDGLNDAGIVDILNGTVAEHKVTHHIVVGLPDTRSSVCPEVGERIQAAGFALPVPLHELDLVPPEQIVAKTDRVMGIEDELRAALVDPIVVEDVYQTHNGHRMQ